MKLFLIRTPTQTCRIRALTIWQGLSALGIDMRAGVWWTEEKP